MSLPHGDVVLSGVSIRASPNLDILDVKFDSKLTFKNHVRGIVCRVSQRIGIFMLVKRIFVNTSVAHATTFCKIPGQLFINNISSSLIPLYLANTLEYQVMYFPMYN